MTRPVQPPPGSRVELVATSTGRQVVAVVDRIDTQQSVVVRAPTLPGGRPAEPDQVGRELVMSWTSPYGRHERPVVLGSVGWDLDPLWMLAPAAEARVLQRRRFTRADDVLPAELVQLAGSHPAVVCDLGEGGARCVVATSRELADDAATLVVAVDGARLVLPGRLLQCEELEPGRLAVRMQFEDIGRAADLLRRHVLERQRLARAGRR